MASTSALHDRIEIGFQALGHHIYRRPWSYILGCLLLTAGLMAGLPTITFDFASDSYLLPGDDARQRYDAFRDRFGLDDRIVVALEPENVFDLEFLEVLRELHQEIETEVPHVEEVLSLINARNTRGEGDVLIVEDLLENWPASGADLDRLREKVLANPSYVNNLVSEDAHYTVILIRPNTYSSLGHSNDVLEGFEAEPSEGGPTYAEPEYLTGPESDEIISSLYALAEKYASDDLTIRLAGETVLGQRAAEISRTDAPLFSLSALLISIVILYLLFRRLSAALLPSLVIVLSMVATFGAMGLMGIPFSFPTQMLPNFLIAVATCDSVHVLAIFFQAIDRGDERGDAIAHALGHSGLAVVLTSLTTAGGLTSFLAAEILPVARLGMIAPVGVLIALGYSLTLLPALLAVIPLSPRVREKHHEVPRLTRWMMQIGARVTAHPKTALFGALAVVVLATPGFMNLRFSHDAKSWLLPGDPARIAVDRMDQAMHGISSVEILIDTGRENGLYEPDVMHKLESVARHALSIDDGPVPVGNVISIVDILKETHRALNANRGDYYAIPSSRQLIAQELLLFENSGSDDLSQVTDSSFQTARLTLRVPLVDGVYYGPFLEELRTELEQILGPELPLEMTGQTVLGNRAFLVVLSSLARSYGLALLIITPLMILMIGSLRLGFASMIPNLIPVYLTLAVMGFLDMPLTISTMIVGSVIIGLAVDDTIHFLHKYDRYFQASGDVEKSVRATFETTGRALVVTTIVIAAAFGVFTLGSMTGIVESGFLLSFGAIVALCSDIVLAPALVALIPRKPIRPPSSTAAP